MEAEDLIGKTVLIGLTNYEANGQLIGHEQLFGTIKAFNEHSIEVQLDNGQMRSLPPDIRPFHFAKKGEYRPRSTGQIVVDPDLLCTYSVTKPQKH